MRRIILCAVLQVCKQIYRVISAHEKLRTLPEVGKAPTQTLRRFVRDKLFNLLYVNADFSLQISKVIPFPTVHFLF
uniref:Uncharacterized protein n=1 Tax=Picea sitchensis TaxID=3332 RepID=B8LLR1_PICSI|nr:unknown [Picea sitchensis]